MTTSRIANSSCVACDDVVTLLRTTVPASISSASLRRAAMALVSFSPKACFPARSAHSAAWMLVLPPLIMIFLPLTRTRTFCQAVPCLKNSQYSFLTRTSQNRRGNFRIAEKPNYRPVIKLPPSRSIDLMFSMRYGIVIPWVHLQSHWLVPRNGKVPDPWLDSQIEPLLPLRSFLPD